MDVEHSAQHLCGLVHAVLRWEPWPRPPFFHFAPSGAEGRPYTDRPDSLEAIQSPTPVFNTHYLIKVPKGLAPDPAWHTASEELGSYQPRLLVDQGRHHSVTKNSQWDFIRKRSFGLFLVTDCGDFAVSSRTFHAPISSAPHSRESPSIGCSLTFEGHILQSCGADIHSVHSFLAGTRRLIRSAAAWGIHPSSCMGIEASIASPAFNLGYTRL